MIDASERPEEEKPEMDLEQIQRDIFNLCKIHSEMVGIINTAGYLDFIKHDMFNWLLDQQRKAEQKKKPIIYTPGNAINNGGIN